MQNNLYGANGEPLFINDFNFSKYTTFGLGGKAEIAYFPRTEQEAIKIFDELAQCNKRFVVIGNGSNILASDKFYDGAVICTKKLSGITIVNNELHCLSGTSIAQLLNFCIKNGIGGYEYLAGIPASLGGLALMNGGIPSKHIGDDVISVRIYNGKILNFSNRNCNFGNKHSIMRDINAIILSISLPIKYTDDAKLKICNALNERKNQPKGRSCGCVFKNPAGLSAGKLIDEAGLKGFKIGNAEVSRSHANFIINKGAKASDVYKIIKIVQKKVFDCFNILLEEEVVYIGEFNDFNS